MFTIKWIQDGINEERLYAGVDVHYRPHIHPSTALTADDNGNAFVEFFAPSVGGRTSIDTGKVFVMNEGGKTVGSYYLSDENLTKEGFANQPDNTPRAIADEQ